jgi:cytochrome c
MDGPSVACQPVADDGVSAISREGQTGGASCARLDTELTGETDMSLRIFSVTTVLALAVVSAGLAACGDQSAEPAKTTAQKPAVPTAAPKPASPPASTPTATPTPASATAAPAAGAVAIDVVDASGTKLMGDPVHGAAIFKQCVTCHTLEPGVNKIGPTLHGIIGRPAGSVEGYNYSEANKNSGIVWSEQKMFEYLENPRGVVPGTKMSFAGLKKPQDRADVIAYIQEQSR